MSQIPTNISAYFADLSSIALSFSDPSGAYFNSAQTFYYLASAVDVSGLKTSYATGTSSPIYIMGLSAGTSYYCTVSTIQTASSDTVSVTTLSYPTITDISLTDISVNFIKLKWTGTDISYAKISRQIGTLGYVDISLVDIASPYNDTDISSGNTMYYYYVTPYMKKYGPLTTGSASAVASGRSAVFYATDLSAIFYDTSNIKVSFTPSTKNNYSTSCTYTLTASGSLYITSVTGASSPLLIQNLSSGTTYTCYIKTTLDSLYTGTSNGLSVSTNSSTMQFTATPLLSSNAFTSSQTNITTFTTEQFSFPSLFTGNYSFQNGTYEISTNAQYGIGFNSVYAFNATTANSANSEGWVGGNYNTSGMVYAGTMTTTLANNSTLKGDIIQIKFPFSFVLTKLVITQTNLWWYNNFYLLGSNTGNSDWITIYTGNGTQSSVAVDTYSITTNTTYYNYYRIVIITGSSNNQPFTGMRFIKMSGVH